MSKSFLSFKSPKEKSNKKQTNNNTPDKSISPSLYHNYHPFVQQQQQQVHTPHQQILQPNNYQEYYQYFPNQQQQLYAYAPQQQHLYASQQPQQQQLYNLQNINDDDIMELDNDNEIDLKSIMNIPDKLDMSDFDDENYQNTVAEAQTIISQNPLLSMFGENMLNNFIDPLMLQHLSNVLEESLDGDEELTKEKMKTIFEQVFPNMEQDQLDQTFNILSMIMPNLGIN